MTLHELKLPKGIAGYLYLGSLPGRSEIFNEDEAGILNLSIQTVVRLTPDDETEEKSHEYLKAIRSNRLKWEEIYYPIKDYSIPTDITTYCNLVNTIVKKLILGKNILIHCGAGIGRSGTLGIAILFKLGLDSEDAFRRAALAGTRPENEDQASFLSRCKALFQVY